jgi:hypothetical protein
MANGREALAAFAAHILQSDSITAAEAWDPAHGWRCALQLSTGRTLLTTPREMRKLADGFSKGGADKIAAAGLTEVIAAMYDVARVVKRRIENHEVPADVIADLPASGSA